MEHTKYPLTSNEGWIFRKYMNIKTIKIGKRFRKNVGDLTSLQESIKEIGLLHPIVVDENNNLIAGFRRLKAFEGLDKKDIPVTVINIENAVRGEFDENYIRKDFVPSEAVAIWEAMESYQGLQGNLPRSQQRREVASKTTNIGFRTLSKAKQVIESGDKRLIKEMDETGNVNKIYKEVKERQAKKELEKSIKQKKSDNQKLSDDELLSEIGIERQLFNIWNVQLDKRFGDEHFGKQPADMIFNLLYYYTKQNDLVYDIFAGGGVVEDVCKSFNRKCISTDIAPTRKSIIEMDITKKFPSINPDFIFMDPPYWLQAKDEYKTNSFADGTTKEFYNLLDDLFERIDKKYKKFKLAFLIANTQWPNNKVVEPHGLKVYGLLTKRFEFSHHIIVPYSTEQYNGTQVNIAKKEKIIMQLHRDLLVFEK